jgi:prepilin-type N-terminal cleavage/methylation domain-containing protein
MSSYQRSRGFTLIEAMIVVAMVGILALLAVVSYRAWVRSSFVTEAQGMVSNIRTAEEAFASENGVYLDVTNCIGAGCTYPLQHPTSAKTAWGAPCGWCTKPAVGWNGLNVQPAGPVVFGYSVVADQVNPPGARGVAVIVNGTALDLTAMSNGAPWFFIEADANISGDNTNFTHVYGMSGTNVIYVDGAGR